MKPLASHVAVVTGAGRGIGRATALRLAAHGAGVAALARSAPELRRLGVELGTADPHPHVYPVDITDTPSLQRVLERIDAELGPVSILINNAGWAPLRTALGRTALADIDRMLATNLRAPILLTRQLLPQMRRRGNGCIVNVASAFALAPHAGEAVYAATKAGLLAFSRALAAECAADGVRVAALCPAYVDTALLPPNRRTDRSRFLRPEDVARTAVDFVIGATPAGQVEFAIPAEETPAPC